LVVVSGGAHVRVFWLDAAKVRALTQA
jgi:hypothetical protein